MPYKFIEIIDETIVAHTLRDRNIFRSYEVERVVPPKSYLIEQNWDSPRWEKESDSIREKEQNQHKIKNH